MIVVLVYLVAGLVAIAALELLTGRVRGHFRAASQETQSRLFVGRAVAKTLILAALWLFWPVAVYGAVETLWKRG